MSDTVTTSTSTQLVKKQSHGGGLATLVRLGLDPVFISEGNDQVEVLVVQIRIKDLHVRVINAYRPFQSH